MSTITKESIMDTIEGLEQLANSGIQSVYIGMAIAGMRCLLASLEAKPVADYQYDGTLITYGSFGYDATPDNPIPLYAIQPVQGAEKG